MYNFPVDNPIKMRVRFTDDGGLVAPINGTVQWDVSDQSIATIVPDSTDSRLVDITPTGTAGDITLTATATSEGGAQVVATCDISLIIPADVVPPTPGDASAGTIGPVTPPTLLKEGEIAKSIRSDAR